MILKEAARLKEIVLRFNSRINPKTRSKIMAIQSIQLVFP
jgi:hypothetical protein